MHHAVIIFGFVVLWSGAVRATPNFPGAVQSHLELANRPTCTLCHNGTPQRGTATTPFAESLRARGLVAYDVDKLEAALDQSEAEQVDSDDDGISDIDELREGSNPNPVPAVPPPEYGCSSLPKRGDPSLTRNALLVLSFMIAVYRRHRQTRHGNYLNHRR